MDIDGRFTPYEVFFTTVMPGEFSRLRVLGGVRPDQLNIKVETGHLVSLGRRGWRWQAPMDPGIYRIWIHRKGTNQTMLVRAFVMVPARISPQGYLNGYRIGHYPRPLLGLPPYYTPRGFIEVSEQTLDVPVSPHFRLGEFVCKQSANGYPRYLVLRPRLLLKLEGLLEDVNRQGFRTDHFVVMSGYRTPFYNHAIGNVPNSRHMWGGAADIYVDVHPRDGLMDDLDHNGRIDKNDARVLYRLASSYVRRYGRRDLIGGVGVYGSTPAHGPFVHVDVRGIGARWGYESE